MDKLIAALLFVALVAASSVAAGATYWP